MALSPKQQRFVAEYLVDLNATQAAVRAGYSAKTARAQGARLLTNADIAAAVADGAERRLSSLAASADQVLEQLSRIALSDPREMFDPHGALLPPAKWTDGVAAAVAGIEVLAKLGGSTLTKVKRWDKVRALELLAKYHGLLKDRDPGAETPAVTRIELVIVDPPRA